MPRIQQLDALVINKIAAGEVIERPASIIKELLENSLDALATRVEVDVAQGGTELIRVVDDGEGIHPDDLTLAVASHATSKIRSDEDLFRVHTLGFRGEALASIASVSKMRIRSRQPDAETGAAIDSEFGRLGPVESCGCPAGTLVEVRQLFANTPVRRKFLRSAATELGHISEQFVRIALAHPRLYAVLRHNGRPVYELPGAEQLADRLRLFYGAELVDKLIWVESQSDNVRLWGYVAHPSESKSTRKGQYLFLNGRAIQDRSLQHALGEAYRGLLMVGRYPVAFLFLEVPPEFVDVNVHPTKAEVRFRDSQPLYRQLLSTLRTRFLSSNLESSMRIPGSPNLAPAPVDPAKRHAMQVEFADWARQQLAEWDPEAPPKIHVDFVSDVAAEAERGDSGLFENERPDFADLSRFVFDPHPQPETAAPNGESAGFAWAGGEQPFDRGDAPAGYETAVRQFRVDAGAAPGSAQRVMQVLDCYLVAETEEGLTVIDQHALHERILYEQFRQRVLAGAAECQKLLVPEPVELGASEAAAVWEHRELLSQLGFGLEEFGKNTLLITGHPPMLARADLGRLIGEVAEQLAGAGQKPTRRDILDDLLHMMSCKAAIKAGQRLSPEEMETLLAGRHLIENAHHCPHGRPTALVLSRADLDRQFGRLG